MRAWQRYARILSDKFGDFLNITLYYRGGWVDVRVVDVILLAGGIVCLLWYWSTGGWFDALQAGLIYLFILLCILWFFPSDKKMK